MDSHVSTYDRVVRHPGTSSSEREGGRIPHSRRFYFFFNAKRKGTTHGKHCGGRESVSLADEVVFSRLQQRVDNLLHGDGKLGVHGGALLPAHVVWTLEQKSR